MPKKKIQKGPLFENAKKKKFSSKKKFGRNFVFPLISKQRQVKKMNWELKQDHFRFLGQIGFVAFFFNNFYTEIQLE